MEMDIFAWRKGCFLLWKIFDNYVVYGAVDSSNEAVRLNSSKLGIPSIFNFSSHAKFFAQNKFAIFLGNNSYMDD